MSTAFGDSAGELIQISSLFNSLLGDLNDKIGMLKNVQEYNPNNPTSFNYGYNTGEPWARESTLQKVLGVLEGGIKVEGKNTESSTGSSGDRGSIPTPIPTPSANSVAKEFDESKALGIVKNILTLEDNISKAQVSKLQGNLKADEEIAGVKKIIKNLKLQFNNLTGAIFDEVRNEYIDKLGWTPSEVKNPNAGVYEVARGIGYDDKKPNLTREKAKRVYGAEYWGIRDDSSTPDSYTEIYENDPTLLHGRINTRNPIVIDAHGGLFTDFENMTVGETRISDLIPDLKKNLSSQSDKKKDTQKLINQWAEKLGADAVIVQNVIDTVDSDQEVDLPTTTIALLDDRILTLEKVFQQIRTLKWLKPTRFQIGMILEALKLMG